jgi:hypothetical protein
LHYIRDATGRFAERPYFEAGELDELSERIVETFLAAKYGLIIYPIATSALELLLEHQDVELDCYADLAAFGEQTDGATVFEPGSPTRVYISKALSEDRVRENRFRTTLAHELGHVVLHRPLYAAARTGDLFESSRTCRGATCTRQSVEAVPQTDWLEWQAGYVSGALLAPITPLRKIAHETVHDGGRVAIGSASGRTLVERVVKTFQISKQAAEVRLQQAGLLDPRGVGRLL